MAERKSHEVKSEMRTRPAFRFGRFHMQSRSEKSSWATNSEWRYRSIDQAILFHHSGFLDSILLHTKELLAPEPRILGECKGLYNLVPSPLVELHTGSLEGFVG